jgi:hypothetical protein
MAKRIIEYVICRRRVPVPPPHSPRIPVIVSYDWSCEHMRRAKTRARGMGIEVGMGRGILLVVSQSYPTS